ncbi:winged helix-turn-helix domain-containing protein [Streptomyces sp. NPDC006208]|uniref:ArsR/SmtB family transcription factor n=1 Tax=Streptomyces sp. NPDC006208 TaxID=3156734 RepID=UPI00339F42B9
MLRIHFTGEDIRRIVVADRPDPLWDVLLSLHMLQDRAGTLAFGEWRRRTRAADAPSARLLADLARPWGYSPDFLTPGRGDADFDTQLDALLSTPRSRLQADMACLAAEAPLTRWAKALAAGNFGALKQLGEALTAYRRVALEPYQDLIHSQVMADRDRRARTLLSGGTDRLLADLHPSMVWRPPVLEIAVYADQDVHLEGRGLVLVPSFFLRIQPITLMDPSRPPVLVYPLPPRLGWLTPNSNRTAHAPRERVITLLGRTRAAVLEAAAGTGTTTQLAARAGVSLPVISRHTAVLREAGLLVTWREGGMVRHRVTGLGLAVLNGELPA